jgi:hypothetical protein
MYPGHERLVASLALDLGALHAAAGDADRAFSAFARSVDARVHSVSRDAEAAERSAAWRAAAIAARAAGAEPIAAECDRRSAATPKPV